MGKREDDWEDREEWTSGNPEHEELKRRNGETRRGNRSLSEVGGLLLICEYLCNLW